MAIDFRAPRTEALRLPLGLAWISAIPARLVLTGIVGASFLIRFVVALAHATPLYFPDEYIYATLARSLAEHGRPLIRSSPAHFPALVRIQISSSKSASKCSPAPVPRPARNTMNWSAD